MEGAEISPKILLALLILGWKEIEHFYSLLCILSLLCESKIESKSSTAAASSLDSTWAEIKLFDFENNAGVVWGDLHTLYLGSLSIARNHR